ncbi:MAG: hypothetical protein KAJ60_08750 [Desulfobulbaceae bacterium]|nr:hypothetical protein [Desulfobulbaceae bacterium]MCK5341148.1 hypothetical protein [Desulfobulbaceae bacterium]MCK5403993.1 hypothetical protein [Desulfobulbaceae bacterium]
MKTPDDVWNDLGELPDDEVMHAVTKLFTIYEDQLKNAPGNKEALNFFRNLDNALTQTSECNLNRR